MLVHPCDWPFRPNRCMSKAILIRNQTLLLHLRLFRQTRCSFWCHVTQHSTAIPAIFAAAGQSQKLYGHSLANLSCSSSGPNCYKKGAHGKAQAAQSWFLLIKLHGHHAQALQFMTVTSYSHATLGWVSPKGTKLRHLCFVISVQIETRTVIRRLKTAPHRNSTQLHKMSRNRFVWRNFLCECAKHQFCHDGNPPREERKRCRLDGLAVIGT